MSKPNPNIPFAPTDFTHIALDADGHLCDIQQWSSAAATHMALALGIALTAEHMTILLALRQFYAQYAHAPNTRPLIKYLQQQVNPSMDSATLMQLFNTGRIAREICRLAGLPKPPNCL